MARDRPSGPGGHEVHSTPSEVVRRLLAAEQRLAESGEALVLWLSADRAARDQAAARLTQQLAEQSGRADHPAQQQEALMAAARHDLRNPLGVIAMSAALLQKKGGLAGWQAQAVDRICSASARMQRIIDELLGQRADDALP